MLKWIEKLIQKIAKANGESFQGQKLDCCELNKNGNNSGTQK
ncbi:MAG: LDCC motif putative metal-binding protein [Clostridia bacterium]